MVVGSYCAAFGVTGPGIPRLGETIIGSEFWLGPGGKGSNQAIAIKRLGGDVYFLAKIGDDALAEEAKRLFQKEGLNTKFILEEPNTHTGAGIIFTDKKGRNAIAVAPGANGHLGKEDIYKFKDTISECQYLLVQMEIPLATVQYAVSLSKKLGLRVILNPAPAHKLSKETVKNIDILIPNETEAEVLTDMSVKNYEEAVSAGRKLLEEGVKYVVMTLGENGALLVTDSSIKHFPAYRVKVVDTTGAGDAFNAGLVYGLSQGYNLSEAIDFGNKAAALVVTRLGVVPALPTLNEIRQNFG